MDRVVGGKFKLGRKLGSGSFGEIFIGVNVQTGEEVAVKLDKSMVIVMDADGARSKGIAGALRKLGIKRPYLVQGGFRSWVKEGLRVKEPKPETTLTILNEEAEAILENINPSPLQVVGVGVGFFAALYALSGPEYLQLGN